MKQIVNTGCFTKRGKNCIFLFLFIVIFSPKYVFAEVLDTSVHVVINTSTPFIQTQHIVPTLFGGSLSGSDKLNFYYFSVSKVSDNTVNVQWKTKTPGKTYVLIHNLQNFQDQGFITKNISNEHSIELPVVDDGNLRYTFSFLESETNRLTETRPFSLRIKENNIIVKILDPTINEELNLVSSKNEKPLLDDLWENIDPNALPLLDIFAELQKDTLSDAYRNKGGGGEGEKIFYFELSFLKLLITFFSYNTQTLIPLVGVDFMFQAFVAFILPIFLW